MYFVINCPRQRGRLNSHFFQLKALECIHSRFIVHRDVKPDNFVFGRDADEENLFIVDFGLSRRYRHPHTLEHAPFYEGGHFAGTSRFASLSAHEGNCERFIF